MRSTANRQPGRRSRKTEEDYWREARQGEQDFARDYEAHEQAAGREPPAYRWPAVKDAGREGPARHG
jgi:hypothetical protein